MQRPILESTDNGQARKSLMERLFPSVYSLWKVIRRSRPPQVQSDGALDGPAETGQVVQDSPQESSDGSTQLSQPLLEQLLGREVQGGGSSESTTQGSTGSPTQPAQPQGYSPPQSRMPTLQPGETRRQDPAGDPSMEPDVPPRYRQERGETPRSAGREQELAGAELEETTSKASEELKALRGVRGQAANIAARAQKVLDEVEAIQEKAERIMAQAHNAFSKAMALNPDALRSMASMVRSLAESIETERQLRQMTRQQAEEEAEWVRQKATDAILSAVSAVRKASNYVSRELDETNRIAATAESLKASSQGDLERAESVLSKAESLMREEARRLLFDPLAARRLPAEEIVPPSRRRLEGLTRPPHPQDALGGLSPGPEAGRAPLPRTDEGTAPQVPREVPADRPQPQDAAEPRPAAPQSQGQTPTGQEPQEGVSASDMESALREFLASTERPAAPPPREDVRGPQRAPADGAPVDDMDSLRDRLRERLREFQSQQPPTPSEPAGPAEAAGPAQGTTEPTFPASAGRESEAAQSAREGASQDDLDSLRRELEAFRQQRSSTEGAGPSSTGDITQQPDVPSQPESSELGDDFDRELLAHLRDSLANIRAEDQVAELPASGGREETQVPRPSSPAPDPNFQEPASTPPPAPPSSPQPIESYSGTVYLVFTPVSDEARLTFLWDVLDTVAGPGMVTAEAPLPDGSGHEFTLDLSTEVPLLEELRKRIPGSRIDALAPDRLRIQLQSMGE